MSDVHSISDAVSETGGIDSDDYMMYDLCTCGSSGRAHKRDCLMNFRRRRLPQSPGESKPDTARSPPLSNPGPPSVSPEPECVVIDDVSPPDLSVHQQIQGGQRLQAGKWAGRLRPRMGRGDQRPKEPLAETRVVSVAFLWLEKGP